MKGPSERSGKERQSVKIQPDAAFRAPFISIGSIPSRIDSKIVSMTLDKMHCM